MYNVCIWIGRFLHGQLLGPNPGGWQVRIQLLDVLLLSGLCRFCIMSALVVVAANNEIDGAKYSQAVT